MKRLKSIEVIIVVFAFVIGLTSCAQAPITFSIEQLGAEAATRDDENLDYRSAVSLTGIAPPYATGKLLSVPGRKLPDVLSVPIVTTCSRIVETLYESDADQAAVLSIAAAIESLRESLTVKAIAEAKLQILANARSTFEMAKRNGTLESEPLLKTFASALGVVTIDEESLKKQEEKISKELNEANDKSKISSDNIVKLTGKKNIFIFRWAMDSKKGLFATVGSWFSSAASESEKRSGYLIAASLRSAALEYGDDLVIKLCRDKKRGLSGSDAVLKNTYIVNYTLGAKHHYFSEDRDIASAVNAALKLSATELNQIFGGGFSSFLKAQSLAVESALKTSIIASARGLVSEPKRKAYPFRLWGDLAFAAGGDAERIRNDRYTIFYSTRSNLATYSIDCWIDPPEGSAYFQCLQSIPEHGSIEETNVTQLTFRFCSPEGWATAEGRKNRGKETADQWKPDRSSCVEFDQSITYEANKKYCPEVGKPTNAEKK